MSEYIVVPEERAGLELDEFLCLLYPDLNKGFIRRQVRDGRILLDGESPRPSQRLRREQVVTVAFDELDELPKAPVAPRQEIPVLYEDEDLLVVDKPAGLAVEPERWAREKPTLSGALLELAEARSSDEAADEEGGLHALGFRPRLVHRIDKDTTGAVVVAKHLDSERALRAAWDARTVDKLYLALVEGEVPLEDGESELIDQPLGPDSRRTGRQRVMPRGGKPAQTRIEVERRYRGFTLLACHPLSGRTHQIRVHLSSHGFPLAVDPFYGRRDRFLLSEIKPGYRAKPGRIERPLIARLTLHAAAIAFPSPSDPTRRIRVEAPLSKDFAATLKQLDKVRKYYR